MNEQNVRLTIGFLQSLVGQCGSCLRRTECDSCFVQTAKSLLKSIEVESKSAMRRDPDYTIAFRMATIEDSLRKAGRPLMSSQIDVRGICYKQLKYATLKILLRMRRISRFRSRMTGAWLYFIPKKKRKHTHENHMSGNGQLQAHQGRAP